ncbi:AAA family ATPase [Myxococcota bacterium]|nr:AAA family ATPase [Myxococcota bacterium]MBU1431104.1 AAA family ATPase [Myxococcota bacterium]MBU1899899.1 AAA family ATPase [Myxococcota bacterium]
MESSAILPPRRFTLVTGKGGVGKSTVAALLALSAADQGQRVLVCELNTQPQIAPLFGVQPRGGERVDLPVGVSVINIEPRAAMEEYALMKLRFRALYRLVFDNPIIRSMVRFVPGMDDLLMLGKAFNHEREEINGAPRWDQIIIDAPATGHSLSFFRLPKIIHEIVPTGNLHAETALMWGLLTDPARCAIHLVAAPEALPVEETLELHRRLRDELGLPLGALFMNLVPPPLPALEGLDLCPALREIVALHAARAEAVTEARRRLSALGMPLLELPLLNAARLTVDDLQALRRGVSL